MHVCAPMNCPGVHVYPTDASPGTSCIALYIYTYTVTKETMFFQAYIYLLNGHGFLGNSKYIIYATLSGDVLVI